MNSTYEAVRGFEDEHWKEGKMENGNTEKIEMMWNCFQQLKKYMKPKSVHHWHERHFTKDACTSFKRSL